MESTVGTDSQDSNDLVPPGISASEYDAAKIKMPTKKLVCTPSSSPGTTRVSVKGIENAKKRLRAFSIQKKSPMSAVTVPKPISSGTGTTVLIGKLSSLKTTPTTPKVDVEGDQKKPPKPPKPGSSRTNELAYCNLRKRTLSEIEAMKRKMELIELGIPLGLICPTATSDTVMPTKAMPPIKTFLDPSKVDELIREAKKAKADGKEFKFDYHKILPDYDNPFQRKRDEASEKEKKDEEPNIKEDKDRKDYRKLERRYSDRYDRIDKNKHRDKGKDYQELKKGGGKMQKDGKETDVNLSDYLVCDSWSLDNEDKTASPSLDIATKVNRKMKERLRDQMDDSHKNQNYTSKPNKMERLKPVIDSFKFEIDPNEDEVLDLFDKECESAKFTKRETKKDIYDSPIDLKLFDYDQDMSKDGVIDANDDNFLESVINEIKQENMSDDTSQDKGLVEYDSPKDDDDDYDSKFDTSQGSVTPELDDRMRDLQSSQQSHYSDGYRSTDSYKSTESGYKSTESGYKSTETVYKPIDSNYKSTDSSYTSTDSNYKSIDSGYKGTDAGYKSTEYKSSKSSYKSPDREFKSKDSRRRSDSRQPESRQSDSYRPSVEKEMDIALMPKMTQSTVDSLETWSFVLKICQPLLFRHDKNKCYKETHTNPKLWYTVNPKTCSCVKDRSVVYEELEMCKMGLVDRVYGCDQIPDGPCPPARAWYPRLTGCMTSAQAPQLATDWETDDLAPRSTTPQQTDEMCIDQEYQRFMKALWPDVAEAQPETSRSTTPVQEESRKKKKKLEDPEKDAEDKKKAKKMKLSSEGWSQESDLEEDTDKNKKIKTEKEKSRKRKLTTSISSSISETEEETKTKKKIKKKENKKTKAKLAKRRRVGKKIKKKLKDKQKKKKKIKIEKISEESEQEKAETKKVKKVKKKKALKLKKGEKKKKLIAKSSSSSSSTTSSSSSDSESELDKKTKIKKKDLVIKKKKKGKKKKRKESIDSSQSEDLFDVNVLNNIKTERLTDDEKNQQMNDFSPRRQKPREREIINVKELQNDFVGNNIHIKQEKEEVPNMESDDMVQNVEFNLNEIPKPDDPEVDPQTEVRPLFEETKYESSMVNLPSTIPLPEEIQLPKSIDVSMIPEPVREPVLKPAPEPVREPVLKPVPELIRRPVPESVQEPVLKHVPEPVLKPVPEPLLKPVPEPVLKPVREPVLKPVPEPVRELVLKPVPTPIRTPVPEPVLTPVPEPVLKHVPEPVRRPVPEPVLKPAPEPVLKPVPEPVLKPVPEPVRRPVPEPTVTQEVEKHIMAQSLSYCNHDVTSEHDLYGKGMEEIEDKFEENFVQDYEMYEHMAMAYQSDVANQLSGVEPCLGRGSAAQRMETVVRLRGEIKCDWRAGDSPAAQQQARPSRWGETLHIQVGRKSLKPGEVNIVLTGGPTVEPVPPPEQFPIRSVVEPVYRIESLATRNDANNASNPIGYDEAYLDTYGASDLLQYGDCFASEQQTQRKLTSKKMEMEALESEAQRMSALDERIDRALRRTILGDVAMDPDDKEAEKEIPDKGILVTKSLASDAGRGLKRVSFADGYKPGQDSDVEEPPVKRKKKGRRYGCAWPCPATHADHVPLWDALPPPPPPRSPPPAPPAAPPPIHLLRPPPRPALLAPPPRPLKYDPNATLPGFMPPEPPPGLITFQ